MLSKNVIDRSYFGIELPSCFIKKKQDSFCDGITAWRMCFIDIVVSGDCFVLVIWNTAV